MGGVEIRIAVRHPDESTALLAIGAALEAAEAAFAKLRPEGAGSEIDLLGKLPSHLWVEISRTTWEALAVGAAVAEATEGAYDYTWPPLRKPWGLRPGDAPRVPRRFEIDTALRRVDWEDVEIRRESGFEARRLTRRTEVDLGPLAEGAALDAAVQRLREMDVTSARADSARVHVVFGGSDERPWRVRAGGLTLVLREGAVAFASRGDPVARAEGGDVYAKLDPRDGEPVEATASLAVAPTAAEAACWAEALLALGDEGRALVEARAEVQGATWLEDGGGFRSPDLPVAGR